VPDLILGIDPGSRQTGYALATFHGRRVLRVELGVWSMVKSGDRSVSLADLARQAESFLACHSPGVAVVESLFHHKNVRSALVLSEARGVLLAVFGKLGIPVAEYSPAVVKKTVSGNGRADKTEVRRALTRTVPGIPAKSLEGLPEDATDALAMAVCHRVHETFEALTGGRGR